ncbi:hypothetical protein RKD39_000040 [Streptomyces albogriseolus]
MSSSSRAALTEPTLCTTPSRRPYSSRHSARTRAWAAGSVTSALRYRARPPSAVSSPSRARVAAPAGERPTSSSPAR